MIVTQIYLRELCDNWFTATNNTDFYGAEKGDSWRQNYSFAEEQSIFSWIQF
jgi:hypothetical protein